MPTACVGDANDDWRVDFQDLNMLLDAWGEDVSGDAPEDIDGNGLVDFGDLNILLYHWDESC